MNTTFPTPDYREFYEKDPYGTPRSEMGSKLDAGKPQVLRGLLQYFPRAVRAVAEVSAFGAAKYTWRGWEAVPDGVQRYGDALARHLLAEAEEGPLTTDSGLLHAAHIAWNAMARLELILRQDAGKVLNVPRETSAPVALVHGSNTAAILGMKDFIQKLITTIDSGHIPNTAKIRAQAVKALGHPDVSRETSGEAVRLPAASTEPEAR